MEIGEVAQLLVRVGGDPMCCSAERRSWVVGIVSLTTERSALSSLRELFPRPSWVLCVVPVNTSRDGFAMRRMRSLRVEGASIRTGDVFFNIRSIINSTETRIGMFVC